MWKKQLYGRIYFDSGLERVQSTVVGLVQGDGVGAEIPHVSLNQETQRALGGAGLFITSTSAS